MSGFSLTLTDLPENREELIAELWESGTTGITEEETWLRAFFDDTSDAQALTTRFERYQPRFEEQDDHDWVQHAQSMWQSFPVGERFWLVPEWLDDPAPEGRIRLPMRPGLACGSGWHPATRLCLEAMEREIRPGMKVLDVGTGSGILAEAAQLLGAALVVGCDIDPEATEVARKNTRDVALFTGTADAIRPASFDIVVANLDAKILPGVAASLQNATSEKTILSGFRESEAAEVLPYLIRQPQQTLELDDWMCAIC